MVIVPFEERFGDGEVDVVTDEVGELRGPILKPAPLIAASMCPGLPPASTSLRASR